MTSEKLKQKLRQAKEASFYCGMSTFKTRNMFLLMLKDKILKNREKIINANKLDVSKSRESSVSQAFIERLELSEESIIEIAKRLDNIQRLSDPLNRVLEEKILGNGVKLKKISTTIGVLFIIYESRPEVTVAACALAVKSGNAAVLKGGSWAFNTNRILAELACKSLSLSGLPKNSIYFLDIKDRNKLKILLSQKDYIDLVIPRGGPSLVKTVVDNSKIPILYHAAGGARIYVDKSANLDMALKVLVNAKTQKPAACNSVDTILVHKDIAKAFLPKLYKKLNQKKVEVIGDACVVQIIPAAKAKSSDWRKEFLSLKVLIGIVKNIDEAISTIAKYTKHHTEAVIAQDKKTIDKFIRNVDAAAIFINCSTRLHDGGVFGMGEEMGIATGRFHARGPVALKELTTYKWIAEGKGQIKK